jgi:hypothetical protein
MRYTNPVQDPAEPAREAERRRFRGPAGDLRGNRSGEDLDRLLELVDRLGDVPEDRVDGAARRILLDRRGRRALPARRCGAGAPDVEDRLDLGGRSEAVVRPTSEGAPGRMQPPSRS